MPGPRDRVVGGEEEVLPFQRATGKPCPQDQREVWLEQRVEELSENAEGVGFAELSVLGSIVFLELKKGEI